MANIKSTNKVIATPRDVAGIDIIAKYDAGGEFLGAFLENEEGNEVELIHVNLDFFFPANLDMSIMDTGMYDIHILGTIYVFDDEFETDCDYRYNDYDGVILLQKSIDEHGVLKTLETLLDDEFDFGEDVVYGTAFAASTFQPKIGWHDGFYRSRKDIDMILKSWEFEVNYMNDAVSS